VSLETLPAHPGWVPEWCSGRLKGQRKQERSWTVKNIVQQALVMQIKQKIYYILNFIIEEIGLFFPQTRSKLRF
jgi:hypothetical protein